MKFSTNVSRGFTLIELLVVISIIGMLSSVVLVSLSSARDKGKIGAGLTFSSSLYHAYGADSVVYVDLNSTSLFNQGESIFTTQSILGTAPTVVSDSPAAGGQSLSFGGNGGLEARFSSAKSIKVNPTVSAWIKPTNTVDGAIIVAFTGTDCSGTRLINLWSLGGGEIQYDGYYPLSGGGNYYISSGLNIPRNSWTHVAYSKDGSNDRVYINGKKVITRSETSSGGSSIGCIRIGTYDSSQGYFTGRIHDVAIYSDPLTASQIENIYAQGLPAHTLAQVK